MADTLDVLTLDAGRQAAGLDLTDSSMDAELARAITAVSRALDRLCGPIVRRTITDETHDGGEPEIIAWHWPITSVSSISERTSPADTYTALTAGDGYRLRRSRGIGGGYRSIIERLSSGSPSTWAPGPDAAKLTYVAGRAVDTASVEDLFAEAAAVTLGAWWEQQRTTFEPVAGGEFIEPRRSFPRFAVPSAVREMLDGEVQRRFTFG